MDWLTSYLLIFAAEIGDKSQLVCMVLAVRYRALPVAIGAILAFILLNSLAVAFGAGIASWIPEQIISFLVGALFFIFGLQALFNSAEEEDDDATKAVAVKSQQYILWSTFLLITVAEFGDKTQLAVVALSISYSPLWVWLGASLALISTSLMAVWAGRTILQTMPIVFLHRLSGVLFILLALFAAYTGLQSL